MPWRVIEDGAMVEVVSGSRTSPAGRTTVETVVRSLPLGRVLLDDQLAPELAKRWADGDEHVRSIVERVDMPGAEQLVA